MEDPAPHDNDDSMSMSEKSGSEHGLTKQVTNGSITSKSGQVHDATSTPTAVRSEQSTWTPAMPPPPRPNFKATPTSAQPSNHSAQDSSQESVTTVTEERPSNARQRTVSSKNSAQETTKPVTRKRSHEEIDRRQATEEEEDIAEDDEYANDEFNEPANPISPFDWEDLELRHHRQMSDCAKQEQALYGQFDELCRVSFLKPYQQGNNPDQLTIKPQYFKVWAESGAEHETTRGFKRMRTQVTLVQHHEEELEKKRQHCK